MKNPLLVPDSMGALPPPCNDEFAFPQNHVTSKDEYGQPIVFVGATGMSLRDYFAGQALAGLAVNQEMLLGNNELLNYFGTAGIDKLQANKAYRLAEAMMAEREKANGRS